MWEIISKKTPHEKILQLEDESWNATVVSDCIIVEKIIFVFSQNFGALNCLNAGGQRKHLMIKNLCVVLTNYHIDEDANHYLCYKNQNYIIDDKIEKMQNVSKNITIVSTSTLSMVLWTPLIVPSTARVISL